MSYASVAMKVSAQCSKCTQSIPLNQVVDPVGCGHCGHPNDIPVDLWVRMLALQAPNGLALDEGESHNLTYKIGRYSRTMEIEVTHSDIRCTASGCGAPMPVEDLVSAQQARCPDCQTVMRARQVPDWFGDVHPAACLLVNETEAFNAQTDGGSESIAFKCYNCGGGLALDGSSRAVTCPFCSTESMVPDQIWQRLHPAPQAVPWWIVFDLGDAVGPLPGRVFTINDIEAGPDDTFFLAYEHYGDGGDWVVRANRRGLMLWSRQLVFDGDIGLFYAGGDGALWVVDEDARTAVVLDAKNGERRERHELPEEISHSLHQGHFAVDRDGTYLAVTTAGARAEVRRHAADGKRLPLWTEGGGFFSRLFGGLKDPFSSDVPEKVPYTTRVHVAHDGRLYLVSGDASKLAWLDRSGARVGGVEVRPVGLERIIDLAVDGNGVVYVLFQHTDKIGSDQYTHIGRVPPGGPFELWVGPHAPEHSYYIGEHADAIAASREGVVYVIGSDMEEIRAIGPDGTQLWRPGPTITEDADGEETIARLRDLG